MQNEQGRLTVAISKKLRQDYRVLCMTEGLTMEEDIQAYVKARLEKAQKSIRKAA
jgi:hypothetical protein